VEVGQGEIVDDVGYCVEVEECIHEEDSLDDMTDDDDDSSEEDISEDEDGDVKSIGSSECSWNSNEYYFLQENYDVRLSIS
jgi:hypothetical protein